MVAGGPPVRCDSALRQPVTVERSMVDGRCCGSAATAAAGPLTIGVSEMAAATPGSVAASSKTWPPASDTPHSTTRSGSTPGCCAAAAQAAR